MIVCRILHFNDAKIEKGEGKDKRGSLLPSRLCRAASCLRETKIRERREQRPRPSVTYALFFCTSEGRGITFSFGQPKEKANKKKGCRLRIRCYSGDAAGYSARKLAATRGSSNRCLTSRRPHRLRLTPRMLMSGDPGGRQAIETCHGASHNSSFLQSRCGVSGRIFASHRRRRWRSVVVETRLIASLLGFHAFTGRQANSRPKRSGVKRTTQRGRGERRTV